MPDLYVLAGMCGGYFVLVYVALWARLNDVWGRICGNIVCTRCDAHGDVCLRKKGYRQQQGPPREVSGSGEGGGRGSTEGVGLAPTHLGDALPPSSLPAPEDQQDVTISPQEDETGEEEKKGCGEEEGEQNAERAEPPAAGAAAREQAPPRRDDSSVAVLGVHTAQCTVKSSRQHRRMVLDVDKLGLWTVKSSERAVFAIMGPSGSGKSTLLNIVAGRKHNDCWGCGTLVHGKVSINGAVLSTAQRRRQIGYVTQEDAQLSVLTVTEAITFSADVRLSSYVGRTERRRRVSTAIDALGLRGVAHSRIGVAGVGGLSGGERRRVSIAVELVVDPLVLLLDEPTTGLDAASASVVMRRLDSLAKRRRVVICTIHQPRPDIFNAIGRVLVLCGGRPAYLGTTAGAAAHFAGRGFPCPEGTNIADHILDVVANVRDGTANIDVGRGEGGLEAKGAGETTMFDIVAALNPDAPARQVARSGSAHLSLQRMPSEIMSTMLAGRSGERRNCLGQCCFRCHYACRGTLLVCGRSQKTMFRRPFLVVLHYLTALVLGPLFGVLYSTINDDISGVQNRVGAFFIMQVLWCTLSLSALDTWNEEAAVIRHERAGGYYSVGSYFLAKVMSDILFLRALPPLLFALIFYWCAGFGHDVEKFVLFALILALTSIVYGLICLLLGALCRSTRVANVCATLVLLFSLLFGGFLVHVGNTTMPLHWCFSLSPLSFACEAMMVNEFSDLSIVFNPVGGTTINGTKGSVWLSNFGFNKNNVSV